MLTPFDKALAAVIGAIVSLVATTKYGGALADPTVQGAIVTAFTGLLVYIVPNKPA